MMRREQFKRHVSWLDEEAIRLLIVVVLIVGYYGTDRGVA